MLLNRENSLTNRIDNITINIKPSALQWRPEGPQHVQQASPPQGLEVRGP